MKIFTTIFVFGICISNLTRAQPDHVYILTGEEKGVEEIVKKDMLLYPEMYRGEVFSKYIRKFKIENNIGSKKYKSGDKLVFPKTLSSIKIRKEKELLQEKYSKENTVNLITFSKINEAWEFSQGAGVKVVVLGWLFDMSPRGSAKYTEAVSMVPGENIGDERIWHGEWMAKTVAQIAPKAKIIPVRARSSKENSQDKDGRYAYEKYLIQGIRYAADHGAVAVMSSMGEVTQCKELRDAIDYAESKGTIFINVHPPKSSQSSFIDKRIINTGVVSVPKYPVELKSNRDIYTWPYLIDPVFRDGWGYSTGPPVTAGVIALIKSANSELNPQEIRKIIITTATTKDGFKVLDANKAVKKAVSMRSGCEN